MSLSVFDIFKIGVGPSSSHTMGPMNAARSFGSCSPRAACSSEQRRYPRNSTARSRSRGAGIARTVRSARARRLQSGQHRPRSHRGRLEPIRTDGRIRLLGVHEFSFDEPLNLLFHIDQVLPGHSNGMRFTAHDAALEVLAREEYYSIGGGFIVQAGAEAADRRDTGEAALRVRLRCEAA